MGFAAGGYADSQFHGWAGTRTDQYRQNEADNDRNGQGCGAEALDDGNDVIVEDWPDFSVWPEFLPENPRSRLPHIDHGAYPHYFEEWVYLEADAQLGVPCFVTPEAPVAPSCPTQQATSPANTLGGVYNGSVSDGSAAGWSYHGGYTPFEEFGVDGIEWVDSGYEFQLTDLGYLGLPPEGLVGLRHNWQVSPTLASALRFSLEHRDLLFSQNDSLSVYWRSSWLGMVAASECNNGPVAITIPFDYPSDVGRISFNPYFYAHDAEFFLDDVQFVEDLQPPTIGTFAGNPNPVIQGANLNLIAGSVFDADGSVTEVRFYRDSNGNGVYDSGTDALFGIAYSGSVGNWQITKTTAGIAVGQHYFFARAKDTDDLWSDPIRSAASIEVTVPANQPPEISDLSDSPDPVDRGDNVTLTATGVSDPDGTIARVEFYRDVNNNAVYDAGTDSLLATDSTVGTGTASVSVDTSGLPAGTVRFLAVAYDNQGAASAEVATRCSIIQKWNLAYQVTPVAGGTISENPAAGRYADGTLINPSAQAAANYRFDHWEVNGTTESMPATLDSDATIEAVFVFNGPSVVAPVLNAIGNQSVNMGTPFSLAATKQQGDTPITWTLENKPTGMTIDGSGVISWPNPTPGGSSHYITVKAENTAGSDTESFTLYVTGPPDTEPPEVAITSPTSASVYSTTGNVLRLAGTVSDNNRVASLSLVNSRIAGGVSCLGDPNWQSQDVALLAGENVLTVTAIDPAGNTASDSLRVFVADVLPWPNNVTLEERRPVFAWEAAEGATWYYIWINRDGSQYHTEWVEGQPTWTPDFDMKGGAYSWWIHPWGPSGYQAWSGRADFNISVMVPGKVGLNAPTGSVSVARPTFSWDADEHATWYYLWVNRSDSPHLQKWVEGSTTYVPEQDLPLGQYSWWVRPWGPDGYGLWSDAAAFSYGMSEPIAPTGDVTGTRQPEFQWTAAAGAAWYQLWVNKNGTFDRKQWVEGSTTLTFAAPFTYGHFEWWVRTWNSSGYGPWSLAADLYIGRPQAIAPLGLQVSAPAALLWDDARCADATWYQFWMNRAGVEYWTQWVRRTDTQDAGGGTRQFDLPVTPSTGAYEWWIRPWNAVDQHGPWSVGAQFEVP